MFFPYGMNGMNQQGFGFNQQQGGFNQGYQQQAYGGMGMNGMGMGVQDDFNRQVMQLERQWEKQRHDEERKRIEEKQQEEKRRREDDRMRRLEDMLMQAQLRQAQQQQPQQNFWNQMPPWMMWGNRQNDNDDELRRLNKEIKKLQNELQKQVEREQQYEQSMYYYEEEPPTAVSPSQSETYFTEIDGSTYFTEKTEEPEATSPTGTAFTDFEGAFTELTTMPVQTEFETEYETVTEKVEFEDACYECMRSIRGPIFVLCGVIIFYAMTYNTWNRKTDSLTDVEVPFGYLISLAVFLAIFSMLAGLQMLFHSFTIQMFAGANAYPELWQKHGGRTLGLCYSIFIIGSILWISLNAFLHSPLNVTYFDGKFSPKHQPFSFEYVELFEPANIADLTSVVTNAYGRVRESNEGHIDAPMMDSQVLLDMKAFNSIYTLTDGNGLVIADGDVSEEEDKVQNLEVTRRRLQNADFGNGTSINSTVMSNVTSIDNGTSTSTARPTLPPITTVSAMGNMTNADSRYFVTLGVGVKIYEAIEWLYEHELTLRGAPIFTEITIGEAISTGMSGRGFAPLSDYIYGIDYIKDDGVDSSPIYVKEDVDPEEMRALRVSLGLLGVIYRVKLEVFPLQFVTKKFEEVPVELTQLDIEWIFGNDSDSSVNQQIKISPFLGIGFYEHDEIEDDYEVPDLDENWYEQEARPRTFWYYIGLPLYAAIPFTSLRSQVIDLFLGNTFATRTDNGVVPISDSIEWHDFVGFEYGEVYVPFEKCAEGYDIVHSGFHLHAMEIIVSRIDALGRSLLGLQSTSCKIEYSLLWPDRAEMRESLNSVHLKILEIGGSCSWKHVQPARNTKESYFWAHLQSNWASFASQVTSHDPQGRFYSKYLYDLLQLDVSNFEVDPGEFDASIDLDAADKTYDFRRKILSLLTFAGIAAIFIVESTIIRFYDVPNSVEETKEMKLEYTEGDDSYFYDATEGAQSMTLYE